MKNNAFYLLFALLLFGCERTPEGYFEQIGVTLEIDRKSECSMRQMESFYHAINENNLSENLTDFIERKNIKKITLEDKSHPSIECEKAILTDRSKTEEYICDPGTETSDLADLGASHVELVGNQLMISLQSQSYIERSFTYDIEELKDEEINDLEKQITKKDNDKLFLSLDLLTDYTSQLAIVYKDLLEEKTEADCSKVVLIDEILSEL